MSYQIALSGGVRIGSKSADAALMSLSSKRVHLIKRREIDVSIKWERRNSQERPLTI